MKIESNRKLKRRVVFDTQKPYNLYQDIIASWYREKHNCSELDAYKWYIDSGLAAAFEDHHRPKNKQNEIIVSEMGQKIN